jgi:hypothetical protein
LIFKRRIEQIRREEEEEQRLDVIVSSSSDNDETISDNNRGTADDNDYLPYVSVKERKKEKVFVYIELFANN